MQTRRPVFSNHGDEYTRRGHEQFELECVRTVFSNYNPHSINSFRDLRGGSFLQIVFNSSGTIHIAASLFALLGGLRSRLYLNTLDFVHIWFGGRYN